MAHFFPPFIQLPRKPKTNNQSCVHTAWMVSASKSSHLFGFNYWKFDFSRKNIFFGKRLPSGVEKLSSVKQTQDASNFLHENGYCGNFRLFFFQLIKTLFIKQAFVKCRGIIETASGKDFELLFVTSSQPIAGGNGNPLRDSCLENSTDRGTWLAIDHRVANSQTQLSN